MDNLRGIVMSYESEYSSSRSRYYNACSEINSCNNRLRELEMQKQQKIMEINKLETDIKNHEEALSDVEKMLQSDGNLNQDISNINNKTDQAADNFIGMIKASDITSRDLRDVYSNEIEKTKGTLSSIIDGLKTRKTTLSNKIEELKGKLRIAKAKLEDIKASIRSTESSLRDWQSVKSSASIDMEYYSRKMSEED
jgi:chromosome segregation ATPase